MDAMTTITSQFQVHIPVAIRNAVKLKKHGRAKIYADGKKIVIEPDTFDIMSLAGKYKVKNPVPAEKIRDHIDYSNL